MDDNWKAHCWLPVVLKESSTEVLTLNTSNLSDSIFPTAFNVYSCSSSAILVHLISEVWNRSQQILWIVGVVRFSQRKACYVLIHDSAGCSLAQEALWLRLWRGKCSFHFTTTSLSQSHSQVWALIGFCWGTHAAASLPEWKWLFTSAHQDQFKANDRELHSPLALLAMLFVIIKVSNSLYMLNLLHF